MGVWDQVYGDDRPTPAPAPTPAPSGGGGAPAPSGGGGDQSAFDIIDAIRNPSISDTQVSSMISNFYGGGGSSTPPLSAAPEFIGAQPFTTQGRPAQQPSRLEKIRAAAKQPVISPITGEEIALKPFSPFTALALVAPIGKVGPNILGVGDLGTKALQAGKVATNTKTVSTALKILSKVFSPKALLFYGAWASSVTIGLWGAAESPESIAFPEQKFLIAEAQRTGNWSLVDQAEEAKLEILDTKLWEKVALWSPISAYVGISKKLKGAKSGAVVMSKIVDDSKKKQETDQSEADYWAERRQEEADMEKAAVDYYNSERKKMLEWEQEAHDAARRAKRNEEVRARNKDAAFWAAERAKQREKEAADRKAIADFWIAYRKKMQEIYENNRPSNLNFGLL